MRECLAFLALIWLLRPVVGTVNNGYVYTPPKKTPGMTDAEYSKVVAEAMGVPWVIYSSAPENGRTISRPNGGSLGSGRSPFSSTTYPTSATRGNPSLPNTFVPGQKADSYSVYGQGGRQDTGFKQQKQPLNIMNLPRQSPGGSISFRTTPVQNENTNYGYDSMRVSGNTRTPLGQGNSPTMGNLNSQSYYRSSPESQGSGSYKIPTTDYLKPFTPPARKPAVDSSYVAKPNSFSSQSYKLPNPVGYKPFGSVFGNGESLRGGEVQDTGNNNALGRRFGGQQQNPPPKATPVFVPKRPSPVEDRYEDKPFDSRFGNGESLRGGEVQDTGNNNALGRLFGGQQQNPPPKATQDFVPKDGEDAAKHLAIAIIDAFRNILKTKGQLTVSPIENLETCEKTVANQQPALKEMKKSDITLMKILKIWQKKMIVEMENFYLKEAGYMEMTRGSMVMQAMLTCFSECVRPKLVLLKV